MKQSTKNGIYVVAIVIVIAATLDMEYYFSYKEGYTKAISDRNASDNELRITMMSIGICEWTVKYRDALGCHGEDISHGKPVPHIPDDTEADTKP